MSARIQDTRRTAVRPVAPDAERTVGIARQSAPQRALSSRQKGPVTAEDEVRRTEWNGSPDPGKHRAYIL